MAVMIGSGGCDPNQGATQTVEPSDVASGPAAQAVCQDWFDAQIACTTEAYRDDQASLELALEAYPDTYCDAYAEVTGDAADAAADLFDCYAAAIEAADCSTPDGLADALTQQLACVRGASY